MAQVAEDHFSGLNHIVGDSDEDLPALYNAHDVSITANQSAIAALQVQVGPPIAGLIRVFVKADFGTFIAGVCTLIPFAVYEIMSPIDLGTDRLEGNNVSLRGNGTFLATIVSATALAVFTSNADGFIFMNGISIQNPVGECFSVSLGTTSLSVLSTQECFFSGLGTGKIGTVNGGNRFTANTSFFIDAVEGLVFDGTILELTMTNVLLATVAGAPAWRGIKVESTASISAAVISGCSFTTENAGDYAVLVETGATLPTSFRINTGLKTGPGGFLDPAGEVKSSPDVIASDNIGAGADSIFLGTKAITGNAGLTTFAFVSTPVQVGNGTPGHDIYELDSDSERFVMEGDEAQNQVLRYKGNVARAFRIDVGAEMDKGGGGALKIGICVFRNGVLIPKSHTETEVSNAATYGSTSTVVTLSPEDTVTACVSNETDAASITVISIRLFCQRVT